MVLIFFVGPVLVRWAIDFNARDFIRSKFDTYILGTWEKGVVESIG